MNKYLKEITSDYKTEYRVPLHTYIVMPNGWCAGYIKEGTTEEIIFKNPSKAFSKSRRKFKDVTKEYTK
jgi:hypothetical protein